MSNGLRARAAAARSGLERARTWRRRQWRRAGLGAVTLGCAGALAACGGGGDGDLVSLDRIGKEDAKNSFTLEMNAGFSPQASTPSFAKGFTDLYTRWAEKHPDWKINLTIIPDAAGTENQAKLLEKARVGRAPDCASVDSFTLPLFINQKVLQPIGQYFTKEEIAALVPFARDIMTGPDGKLYAWWWQTDLRALYRRTDLVPEAPRTWDELIAAAKAAHEKDSKVDGYLYNGGRWEGTTFDNLAHFWSQGGELVDDKGKPIFGVGKNREYMLNVLNFLKRTIDEGASPKRVATIKDYAEFLKAAQSNRVAMFQGGSFQYPTMQETLPPDEFKKWEISAIPAMQEGQEATGTGGWTIAALSKDPKKAEMCMSLVKEIYVGGGNRVTNGLPTSEKIFEEDPTFQKPIFAKFREYLPAGKARPGVPIYPEMSNQLQVAIGNVLTGQATPEEALDAAKEAIDRAAAG
jgi:multiple sugar transport system substrate-binding protein